LILEEESSIAYYILATKPLMEKQFWAYMLSADNVSNFLGRGKLKCWAKVENDEKMH